MPCHCSETVIKTLSPSGSQRPSLILDPCPLHLHQLLKEGVIGEAVLVRVGHTESLQDLRLFGFVEAGENIPGRPLITHEVIRGHWRLLSHWLMLASGQRASLIIHSVGLESCDEVREVLLVIKQITLVSGIIV